MRGTFLARWQTADSKVEWTITTGLVNCEAINLEGRTRRGGEEGPVSAVACYRPRRAILPLWALADLPAKPVESLGRCMPESKSPGSEVDICSLRRSSISLLVGQIYPTLRDRTRERGHSRRCGVGCRTLKVAQHNYPDNIIAPGAQYFVHILVTRRGGGWFTHGMAPLVSRMNQV